AQDGQIDLLLQVHVDVVVGTQYVIHDFEFQAARHELQQMGSIEAGKLHAFYGFTHVLHNRLDLAVVGAVGNDKAECDAAQLHALVVLDGLLEQLGVGANDLFSTQAANACGLEPNVLNAPGNVAHYNEVAWLERFVQTDGRGSEQVAKNHLGSQRHRDAANAQARDKGRDIDAEVIQNRQDGHGPQHRAQGVADQGQRDLVGSGVAILITRQHEPY